MGGILAFLGRRPLVGAAVLFTVGVALSGRLPSEWGHVLLGTALGLAACAALLARFGPGISTLVIFVGFLVGGAGAAALRAQVRGIPAGEVEWLLEGDVDEPPALANDRLHLVLAVDHVAREKAFEPAQFRARISSEPVTLFAGDRVRVKARLSPPPRDANPGSNGLEARWRAEGIAATGTVVDRQLAAMGEPPVLARIAAQFRDRYALVAQQAIAEPAAQALVRALAVGDRAELGAEVNDDFNASGLAHILSVSGLHIAVVAAGLYRLLRWLLSRSERLLLRVDVGALAALSALPATWLYVWVTGSEVPAVRSGIMTSAIFLAMALRRDADTPSSLAAALLAVLAWDPAALWSISCQLSFCAVAGLMLFTGPIRALVPIARPDPTARGWRGTLARAGEAVLSTATGSLGASLASAPLVAIAFHRASLVAVLSNCVALPVASLLTVFCASSAAALSVGTTPAAILLCLAEPLARLLLFLSHLFATLPFASRLVPSPSAPFILAWYGALGALALMPWRKKLAVRLAVPSLAVLTALALWRVGAPLLARSATVTFLAVGQGDSSLVQLPGGEALLIDGGGDPGGRFDPGERIVVPALAELGATHLRAAVLSHPHPDHLQGLATALGRVRADELWIACGLDRAEPLLAHLLAVAKARGVPVRELCAGARVELQGASVEVLHPTQGWQDLSANDASLVLRLRFGEVSFLFDGDIEQAGEEDLLAAVAEPAATVLKAPHHGSRTSSTDEFVARVHPRHVVFCLGKNHFGFPHPEVVARYRALGTEIHRTDTQGALTFRTDGKGISVEPFVR